MANTIKCGVVGEYTPKPIDFRKDVKVWNKVMDDNCKRLMALDARARRMKSWVGRIYREQIADGYAIYLIVAESARTVTLKHVKGLWDDYMTPFLGSGGVVDKGRIVNLMKQRDALNALFGR